MEFNLGPLVKDDEEVAKITNIIADNYLILKDTFLESIKSSEKYPRVDFVTAMKTYSSAYNQRPERPGGKELLLRSITQAMLGDKHDQSFMESDANKLIPKA